jgi:hypothetical protein
MKRFALCLAVVILSTASVLNSQQAQSGFDGLNVGMGNLCRLSHAKSRSISAENVGGENGKGGMATTGLGANAARDLGQTWKVSPAVKIESKQVYTVAEIEGPGAIQHIWMSPSPPQNLRFAILRFYWDSEATPSVEVPIGDFFASGWGRYGQISSLAVCANPLRGYNSYWQMPFRKSARVTLENLGAETLTLYYQVDYTLTEVPADAAYFHAQFRRSNPLPYKTDHVIIDGVRGWGQYVGTSIAWGSHSNGWWGEGEIKFFIDGDSKFPTICGTGTEDYFCGSHGFEITGPDKVKHYQEFTTPYSGLSLVTRPDGLYDSQQRFSLYRWHIVDPVRFEQDLKVTIQALGWRSGGRYLPLQDDIASTAFWYQTEPHAPFPPLPDKDALEIK